MKIVLETFDLQREIPLWIALLSSNGNAIGLIDDVQVTLLEHRAKKKKKGCALRSQ